MIEKHGKDEGLTDHWIEEENLNYQARKIRSRIEETAQIAEMNFWEYISGSFPEVTNLNSPAKIANGFSKACCDAVTVWYVANAKLDEKLRGLITNEASGNGIQNI